MDQVFVVGHIGAVSFSLGESIALVSAFTGISQPTAQWYLNGLVVDDSDPRITITETIDQNDPSVYVSTLTIMSLIVSDGGNYESRVSNNVIGGEVSENVTLVPLG